jgi:hypothetical protein
MKIHQLFRQKVETGIVFRLLRCFGLECLEDKKMFSKYDLIKINTLQRLSVLRPELEPFYLPCKAKVYLYDLTEKKCITVLKQVLRLHGYFLVSKERNINNKKVIFYVMMNEIDKNKTPNMKRYGVTNVLTFN